MSPWLRTLIGSIIITVFYLLLGYFLLKNYKKNINKKISKKEKNIYLILFISGLLISIISLILTTTPNLIIVNHPDSNAYITWGKKFMKYGLFDSYYHIEGLFDYPPLMAIIIYICGLFTKVITNENILHIIFKLPSIIVFILSIFEINKIFKNDKRLSNILVILLVFNPAVIMDVFIWGQTDMFVLYFSLLIFRLFKEEKYSRSLIAVFSGLLFKSQIIFGLPIIAIAGIKKIKEKKLYKKFIVTLIPCLIIYMLLYLYLNYTLIVLNGNYKLLLGNFYSQINHMPFYSANCQNFWAMLDLNLVLVDFNLPWITTFVLIVSITYVSALYIVIEKVNIKKLFLYGGFMIITIVMFSTSMHERYIIAGPTLLLIGSIQNKNKNLIILSLISILLCYINIAFSYVFSMQEIFYITYQICGGINFITWLLINYCMYIQIKK